MKHISRVTIVGLALLAFLFLARDGQAQRTSASGTSQVITAARVAMLDGAFIGPLYITIGGQEKKIADEVLEAWIIQGGRRVVYSGRDGSGGFENEGQSLRVYDPRTDKHRKILSEYVMVDTVTEATTSTKKTALLVKMSDGGLGASYFAVVDPNRGEVFFRRWVKLLSRKGDVIVLGHFTEDNWNDFVENENARIKPYKRERQNLNNILRRRVIYNKPDR